MRLDPPVNSSSPGEREREEEGYLTKHRRIKSNGGLTPSIFMSVLST